CREEGARRCPRAPECPKTARPKELAQNHPPVDVARTRSDKADKITSIGAAQSRINSSISCVGYDGLSAVGAIPRPAKSQESTDAWKEPDCCWVACERRGCDSRAHTMGLR